MSAVACNRTSKVSSQRCDGGNSHPDTRKPKKAILTNLFAQRTPTIQEAARPKSYKISPVSGFERYENPKYASHLDVSIFCFPIVLNQKQLIDLLDCSSNYSKLDRWRSVYIFVVDSLVYNIRVGYYECSEFKSYLAPAEGHPPDLPFWLALTFCSGLLLSHR